MELTPELVQKLLALPCLMAWQGAACAEYLANPACATESLKSDLAELAQSRWSEIVK
jgi:hypothetical protein